MWDAALSRRFVMFDLCLFRVRKGACEKNHESKIGSGADGGGGKREVKKVQKKVRKGKRCTEEGEK